MPTDWVTVLGVSYVMKEVVARVFGPTLDHYGEQLKSLIARRKENTAEIFSSAASKARGKEGILPPTVLRDVINDGSFREDPVAKEYYASIIASSLTKNPEYDMGSTYTNLLSRLSNIQIRAHYIFYSAFRICFLGKKDDIALGSMLYDEKFCLIHANEFSEALSLSDELISKRNNVIEHCISGLVENGLLSKAYVNSGEHYGGVRTGLRLGEDVIFFGPTILGARLFLRCHGMEDESSLNIVEDNMRVPMQVCLTIPECIAYS